MMAERRWLSTAAAAKLAGVSEYMLYRDVALGLIPAYRPGKRSIRYRYADVVEYNEKRRAEAK